MNDATNMRVEGFATGRVLPEALPFRLVSAGPQEGQYDPRPRYTDGTLVSGGFATKSNRGRPKGTGTGLGIGHSKEAKEEMVRRYKNGEGLHPLAAAFSTTAQRVREIVIQAGVEIRQAGYCRKEKEQRSDDMGKVIDIQPEQIHQIHERYMAGERLADCVAGQGLSVSTAISRFNGLGLKYPRPKVAVTGLPPRLARSAEPPHLVDLVADAAATPPDPAMDDPTPGAAAPTEPATEIAVQQALARERARALRERVVADTKVIAAQELTVTHQRPYVPPAVIFDGVLNDLVRPQNVTAVARTVVKLVEALNAIPGVRADFGFVMEMSAGVRP